ncbi:MAG: hypothetical protein OEV66_10105 [Spirochaetia bacterium]|nr:hypothetical protein [Spirochaetia bacterium]
MIKLLKRQIALSVFFMLTYNYLFGAVNSNKQPRNSITQKDSDQNEIIVLPPRIILFPFFSKEIRHFSLLVRNATPIDKAKIRILIPGESGKDTAFFTNNIQWKKIDHYYYLTNIYGKPAEIPIVENFFKLEVAYRYNPGRYTAATLEIMSGDRKLKSIPVDFFTPLQMDFYAKTVIEKIKNDPEKKGGAAIIAVALLWAFYEFMIRRRRKEQIPLCSTRARFSTMVEENREIYIGETKNPFGCRLGGLQKMVKIAYQNSDIRVFISGKLNVYPDKESVSIDINKFWKLRIEAQNYYGDDQKSHKNLVVLLLPV